MRCDMPRLDGKSVGAWELIDSDAGHLLRELDAQREEGALVRLQAVALEDVAPAAFFFRLQQHRFLHIFPSPSAPPDAPLVFPLTSPVRPSPSSCRHAA